MVSRDYTKGRFEVDYSKIGDFVIVDDPSTFVGNQTHPPRKKHNHERGNSNKSSKNNKNNNNNLYQPINDDNVEKQEQ